MRKTRNHELEQNAYDDWAAIAVGGQCYLFCDYDPADAEDQGGMSVAWFTSSSINEPFKFCGNAGHGHPDPVIMFAEGKLYLVTQTSKDFVNPGPWVKSVEVRVGVDTNSGGAVNQWTDWQEVIETYAAVPGFAKQVSKTPAKMDLSGLPEGYGFQFEFRLTETAKNESKPQLDRVSAYVCKVASETYRRHPATANI